MESGADTGVNSQQQIPEQPKKSKRKLYGLIALALAVIIYIIVPSGAPKLEDESVKSESVVALQKVEFESGEVTIQSFEIDKKFLRKKTISGILSNTSDAPIESIEFEAVFSDNTEFVTYEGFIAAGEEEHEFSVKVTGHKGAALNALRIRQVQKAQ